MSKMVLILPVYKTERGSQAVDLEKALDSLDQAIRKLTFAVDNPRSPEGMSFLARGFISIILFGVKGREHVELFHAGGCESIADDGCSVVYQPPCPIENARMALDWLKSAYQYTLWVRAVEKAALEDRRPPVFDTETIGFVPDEIRQWIGQNADGYFSTWQAERLEKAAAHAAEEPVTSR